LGGQNKVGAKFDNADALLCTSFWSISGLEICFQARYKARLVMKRCPKIDAAMKTHFVERWDCIQYSTVHSCRRGLGATSYILRYSRDRGGPETFVGLRCATGHTGAYLQGRGLRRVRPKSFCIVPNLTKSHPLSGRCGGFTTLPRTSHQRCTARCEDRGQTLRRSTGARAVASA
jgi:hypothetical protein